MESKTRVTVIGAGELGSAIGGLLQRNGLSPVLWDADPARVPGQGTLADTVKDAECVLFCIPSWTMRDAIGAVMATGALRAEAVVVSFAKGMEDSSGKGAGKTMTELFEELFSGEESRPFAVVGGPMLAEEIVAGKGAVAVFASKDRHALDTCRTLFTPPSSGNAQNIRTEFLNDPFSLSVASVLKNVYAVALGIADGLGLSENEKGWITAFAVKEMATVAESLKADPEVALGTGGVGDLVATGYSGYSRNRGIGAEIARTGTCTLRGEGTASLPSLKKRIGDAASFPLLRLIHTISIECKPAREAFNIFFRNAI